MSHTPVPWIMEHDEEKGNIIIWAGSAIEERHSGIYDSAGEMKIYDCIYNDSESDKECIANARLIAAAPELLEALKELIQAHELKLPPKIIPPHKLSEEEIRENIINGLTKVVKALGNAHIAINKAEGK